MRTELYRQTDISIEIGDILADRNECFFFAFQFHFAHINTFKGDRSANRYDFFANTHAQYGSPEFIFLPAPSRFHVNYYDNQLPRDLWHKR